MAVTTGKITKTTMPDAFDLRIRHFWRQGYGEPDHEWEQIYRTMPMGDGEGSDKRFSYMSGFGLWEERASTGTVPFDSVYQGYDCTVMPYTYWRAFKVDRDTIKDDPTSELSVGRLAAALAEAGRDTWETLAATPFNSCTATTYCSPWQTGSTGSAPDGVSLLSTSHPILTGGTYANTPSTQVALSITSLQAARTRMEKMQNARGLRWGLDAETLLVPTDLRWLGQEILGSPQIPYIATSTPNVVREGLKLVVWSKLTDANNWFLLAKKAGDLGQKGHLLSMIVREKPNFDRDNEFRTGDREYKGVMRIGIAIPDFRGVDGSTPS